MDEEPEDRGEWDMEKEHEGGPVVATIFLISAGILLLCARLLWLRM